MKHDLSDLLDALEGTAYAVDTRARFIAVGARAWRRFALDNDAAELADPSVLLGCDLFDFILGDEVRQAYRQVMERARQGEPEVTLAMRCDAPDAARLMRLVVSALTSKGRLAGYLFQCVLLDERARPPLGLFAFGTQGGRDQSWPTIAM
ncbi:MAG TPA: hypothetical protein VLL76_09490, partial [Candidatus Omnitrophota bacterium]|nr:hypothetical protein [Candidatus Omnitrophota bacterium]